jgi:hypothetical protein
MNLPAVGIGLHNKRQSKMSLKRAIKDVHERTWREVDTQLQKYGATRENLSPIHVDRLDRILDSDDLTVAEDLAKRGRMAVFFSLLRQWGQGKITPNTVDALEKRAKSAESFAKWREKEGDLEAAERQRQRAADLQAQADKLRAEAEVMETPVPMKKKRAKGPKKPTTRRKK